MNKDHFILGALLAMIAPLLAFASIATGLISLVEHKPAILYAIALLINLLLMRYYYGKGFSKSAQGIILMTFIIVIFVVSLGQLSMGTDSYY